MLKLVTFIVASAALIYVSRASLRAPRSHGFCRFFAWEFILALILLNIERWFQDPFSIRQILSWLLLIGSVLVGVPGIYSLRTVGKPGGKRNEDVPTIWIEKTTTLVTAGVFKHVRHPLYSSLLFLAWGVFFKHLSWLGGGLAVMATLLLVATAKVEEAECTRFFGPAYQTYMKRTKMFIPFLL